MRLTINYLLRGVKNSADDLCALYVRFTLDQKRVQFSTGIKIQRTEWDESKQLLKESAAGAKVYNSQILKITTGLHDAYNQLISLGGDFNVQDVENQYLGEASQKGLLTTFDYYLDTIENNLGKGYAYKTLEHYRGSKKKLAAYLKDVLRKKEIPLNGVDYHFLNGFDAYLKRKYKIHQNTAWNYHKHLKRVFNLAISLEYLEKNPYRKFKVKKEESHRDFLTLDEIKKLEQKEIDLTRLSVVRDVFLFACYTGLSYADISKLKQHHIQLRDDGNYWILILRTKTKTESKVPLLENLIGIREIQGFSRSYFKGWSSTCVIKLKIK